MRVLLVLLVLSFISFTPFSKYSKFNKTQNCYEVYVCISNDSLQLNYQSFGGFKFANDKKAYKNLQKGKKSPFKNIIMYGWSNNLNGDYYLLLDNELHPENYQYKDTIIQNRKITIALSNSVTYKTNTDFLLNFKLNK